MLNLHHLRWGTYLGIASMLSALGCAQGPRGETGEQGKQGQTGQTGQTGPLQTTEPFSGTVTDGAHPLSGVTVTLFPGGTTETTDGAGFFELPSVAIGASDLTFHLAGYDDKTVPITVTWSGPNTVDVTLVTDPIVVTVSDQLTAGYGAPVTVQATAKGTGALTYAWTQTAGPAVTLTGADTDTLSFTTLDFATAVGPLVAHNARFDVLGLDPDQAGGSSFQVTVSDAYGHTTEASVDVSSTRPTSGIRMVPTGIPVWLQGDGPLVSATQTTWSWALDTSAAPGSAATIANPTSQFPSFVPDVAGTYAITETVANRTMNVYADTWLGEMTVTGPGDDPPVTPSAQAAQCTALCHNGVIAPDVFAPWKGTAHASAMQNEIDGADGPGFAEPCLSCHTLGYDRSAVNGNFANVAATSGWTFPATLEESNWSALESIQIPNDLADVAGVQCESCHGPQGTASASGPHHNEQNPDLQARISWSEAVCARCHQESPGYYKPSQWATSPHADLDLALSEGSVENSPDAAHCGRCHTAQGYAQYVSQLVKGGYGYITSDGNPIDPPTNTVATAAEMTAFGMSVTEVQSQTCATCHDPHDNTANGACPNGQLNGVDCAELRVYDAVAALPNGLTGVSGMGAGMICATCHNSRDGEHTDEATMGPNAYGVMVPTPLTSFSGPHAASQTDAVFGFNAYFVNRLNPSPHLAVADTCAGCHFKVTTASEAAAKQTSNHSFLVDTTVCASCHSANVDGVALQAANQAQLDALRDLWANKLLAPLTAALDAAPGATILARAYDPATGDYSSKSSSTSNVVLGARPTAITYAGLGTSAYGPAASAGVTLTLAAPVTVQFVETNGDPVGSPVTTSSLTVSPSSLKVSSGATTVFAAPSANAADVLVLYKAYWNMVLLNNDNTFGIHNPGFFDAVCQETTTQLDALP